MWRLYGLPLFLTLKAFSNLWRSGIGRGGSWLKLSSKTGWCECYHVISGPKAHTKTRHRSSDHNKCHNQSDIVCCLAALIIFDILFCLGFMNVIPQPRILAFTTSTKDILLNELSGRDRYCYSPAAVVIESCYQPRWRNTRGPDLVPQVPPAVLVRMFL